MADIKSTATVLKELIADFKEKMPEMTEYVELKAQLRYKEFTAYQQAGFNTAQAMQMVIASIKG